MTVYVDTMKAPYGRMIMCHCWADSVDELFSMMNKIGVNTKWFQKPPKASWEHFDISQSKRKLAILHGAIETDRYGPVEHNRRIKFIESIDKNDYHMAEKHLKMFCIVGNLRREQI